MGLTTDEKYLLFGKLFWEDIQQRPFGVSNKREIEITIIDVATKAGLIDLTKPVDIAIKLRMSLSKTHNYLTDLSHKKNPLSDLEALKILSEILKNVEALPDNKHLSFPLHRADVRIWLERKIALHGYHPGESIRRDVAKLTPHSLLKILDKTASVKKPAEVLNQLEKYFEGSEWIEVARREWNEQTNWIDVINVIGTIHQIIKSVPIIIKLAAGL